MRPPPPERAPWLSERAALVAAVLTAIALRVWEAAESSLWLDELHTLSHASQPGLAALLAQVELERVHVPLFFAFTQLFGGFEEGAWLRWIPIAASIATLVPLWALAREALGDARSALVAAWLFACLPYHVHWGAELRPYAWWGLFSAGAAWAAFSQRSTIPWKTAVFFACALAGIWTHRLMAVSVLSIGLTRLVVRAPRQVPLARLVLAGAVAFAPMALWAVRFAERATTDRLEYQAQVGGFRLRSALLKEFAVLPLRLAAPYLGALGAPWVWLAKLGTLGLLAGVATGAWPGRGGGEASEASPAMRALVWFAATQFVITAALAWWTWDRLPLQYFLPVAWTVPMLLAAVLARRRAASRVPTVVVCAAALVLGVAQAGGRGVEDMRGAVREARRLGAALRDPIYTALLSQPSLFEHTLPFRAYGKDLDCRAPTGLPRPGDEDFVRPVIVLRRGQIPVGDPPWAPLLEGREVLERRPVDTYLTLFVLGPTR